MKKTIQKINHNFVFNFKRFMAITFALVLNTFMITAFLGKSLRERDLYIAIYFNILIYVFFFCWLCLSEKNQNT